MYSLLQQTFMLSLLCLGQRHNVGQHTLALLSRSLQSPGEKLHHHTSNFSATVTERATDKCTLYYEIVNRVLTRTVTVHATEGVHYIMKLLTGSLRRIGGSG